MSGERSHTTPSRARGVCVQGSGQASAVKFPSQLTYHPRHNLRVWGSIFGKNIGGRQQPVACHHFATFKAGHQCASPDPSARAHFHRTRFGLCLWPCGRSVRRPGRKRRRRRRRRPARVPGRGPRSRPLTSQNVNNILRLLINFQLRHGFRLRVSAFGTPLGEN